MQLKTRDLSKMVVSFTEQSLYAYNYIIPTIHLALKVVFYMGVIQEHSGIFFVGWIRVAHLGLSAC